MNFRIQPQKQRSPSDYSTLVPSFENSHSLTLSSDNSFCTDITLAVTYLSLDDLTLRRAQIPLTTDGNFIDRKAPTFVRFEDDSSTEAGEGITLKVQWTIQDDLDKSGSEEMVARLEDLLIRDAEPWLPEPKLMRKKRRRKRGRRALVVPKLKGGKRGVSFRVSVLITFLFFFFVQLF